MLLAAAAERFGVRPSDARCAVARHAWRHPGKSATFGELGEAAAQAVRSRSSCREKSRLATRSGGRARPRFDIRSKVDGSAVYGIDFTLPGMMYAAVDIAPVYGGKLVSVDTAAGRSDAGRKRVVSLEKPSPSSPTAFGARTTRSPRSSRSSTTRDTAV